MEQIAMVVSDGMPVRWERQIKETHLILKLHFQ